ncbi:DUF2723 domain-containing protein [Flavobacterium rhizosphaerae]|uniref:DUF2723 domain-containing protein n=1 Tax=Flavobacterium rhizosphaerae TaxID=3163298 RepID=A0ABW8YT25_9FLAO
MTDITFKKWNTLTGWLLFLIAFTVYNLTVEPTVSFWDCGEYISTSAKLQAGHPPGAPLFQILGAVFALFASSPQNIAYMVNMVSVLSGAFTILFMFWSLTILLKQLFPNGSHLKKENSFMIFGADAIGALTFLFSDSFWFNATEAEVYAMASLFIALLLWAGLRWGEEMHKPQGNRWLLLIALLTGFSFGVHFVALLTIPSIGLIYYFKNYKTITIKKFIIANIAIVVLLLFVFVFLLPYTLALFAKAEIFMVNSMGMPFHSGTLCMFLLLASFFYFGLQYTRKKNLPLYNTALLCILFLFVGFSAWMMLPVRANANVVINENNPADAADVLAYYNREQYPEQKVFYGPLYTSAYSGLDKNQPYIDEKPNYERNDKTHRYEVVNEYKNARQNLDSAHKAILPRMVAPDRAANYMAYAGAPKFRLNPNYDFSHELIQYGVNINTISQEEAGAAIAKLRGQTEQLIGEVKAAYNRGEIDNRELDNFLKEYGEKLIVEKPTLGQNMAFMANYQFGYMFGRYLMWNFAGRQSDIQGEGDNINGNWLSGITFIDEARLGPQEHLTTDMLKNKGRNTYFLLPFILGIAGLVYHARKHPKSFYILLALFLINSIALKIFLNEKPFEVRERDYVMVGAYYVFALWVGFGVFSFCKALAPLLRPRIAIPAALLTCLFAAPVLMASENWDDHDRSGRYTALAMAKAFLDSCEPNAILFTIGDNDTFPLWYAQEIEGYRTDVRVICNTLLPTDWYIDAMKRQAYDSAAVPISFKHDQYVGNNRDFVLYYPKTDERISIDEFINFIKLEDERATVELRNGHRVHYYPSNKVRFAVDRDTVIKNKAVPPGQYNNIVAYIDIDLPESAIYKNNLMMLDIIRNNNWKRPIYFSMGSTDEESFGFMKNYLQLTGVVYKLVPVKTEVTQDDGPMDMGYVDSKTMYDTVMHWDWGNSSDDTIYHDPETRRNSITYRYTMSRLADTLIEEGQIEKAHNIADLALKHMPVNKMGYYLATQPFADAYYKTGDIATARKLLETLVQKYRENLLYYNSQKISWQNSHYNDIAGDIERYRNLLHIAKQNNDIDFYNRHKKAFNQTNTVFSRFNRKNE